LKEDLARSRQRVERELRGMRYELDFPGKIRRSFRHRPALWIAAAATAGLVITLAISRKKKVKVDTKKSGDKAKSNLLEAGFLLGVLKIAATMLKPVIVPLIERKVSEFSSATRGSGKWRA
jgi:hypothetical protein